MDAFSGSHELVQTVRELLEVASRLDDRDNASHEALVEVLCTCDWRTSC
jgi:hypothetical protein